LLNAKWTIVQLYHGEYKLHIDDMMMMRMMTALYSPTRLVGLAETTVHVLPCRSTGTHYSDSEATSLSSYYWMLHAWERSSTY